MKKLILILSLFPVFLFGQIRDTQALKRHVELLASDLLQGRGTGDPGEKTAGDYVIREFESMGLKPMGDNKTWRQPFTFVDGIDRISFSLKTGSKTYESGASFLALPQSDTGKFEFPAAAFEKVGLGIIDSATATNNYKGKNVKGKIALLQAYPSSGFNPHSAGAELLSITSRIRTAKEQGAVAVIFYDTVGVNSSEYLPKENPKAKFESLPAIWVSKDVLSEIEKNKSLSLEIHQIALQKKGYNILAAKDNGVGKWIVIGGHYDHLGLGEQSGSLEANSKGMIHNGADDNASGTAGVIELARYYSKSGPAKADYLFICFSGEELGLLGSKYVTEHCPVPLDKISFMINMDMIGRYNPEKGIVVSGVGTSPSWVKTLDSKLPKGMTIKTDSSGIGPSDHTSFYLKDIPVLHFFTGTHSDYHKPSDDIEKLNLEGERKVLNYIAAITDTLSQLPKLEFTKTATKSTSDTPAFKVTLGIIPDYTFNGPGVKIDGVTTGRPAEKAGILTGDIILKLSDFAIGDIQDYMKGLSKFSKGQTIPVTIKRAGKELSVDLTF